MNKEIYVSVNVLEGGPAPLTSREPDAVRHLRQSILRGKPWYEALLEAIGMWTLPEERYDDRVLRYVIQGEAFDWILLAERLCHEVDGAVPSEELEGLLFKGHMPMEISSREFRDVLGYNKYRGLLNFWYGVVVEEVLQMVVEDEVRKVMTVRGHTDVDDLTGVVYRKLYDDEPNNLLENFCIEMKYSLKGSFTLTQAKEFNYWLFKLRLRYWDPARVASDTRKALQRLQQLRGSTSPL